MRYPKKYTSVNGRTYEAEEWEYPEKYFFDESKIEYVNAADIWRIEKFLEGIPRKDFLHAGFEYSKEGKRPN